jgi:nicotinamide-nucleotide amidase
MFPADLVHKAETLVSLCRAKKLKVATAESCTGGLVGGLITAVAGSSDIYDRGFITYSNEAKRDCLGVAEAMLTKYGAVSEDVARAMAEGALAHSRAHIAVSITGIAGPGGGSADKPVGLVHFACGQKGAIETRAERFGDRGRAEVRLISVATAIDLLLAAAAHGVP